MLAKPRAHFQSLGVFRQDSRYVTCAVENDSLGDHVIFWTICISGFHSGIWTVQDVWSEKVFLIYPKQFKVGNDILLRIYLLDCILTLFQFWKF